MLALDMTVTFEDESKVEVKCKTSDFLAFESHFDKSFDVLTKDARLTYLMFLAWHAMKRTGKTDKPMDVWADDVSMVSAESPKA
jgi:hypothetical protein